MHLGFGDYYDDVEPKGVLGAARVYKKLGCFYFQLFDLQPATRASLLFISRLVEPGVLDDDPLYSDSTI